MFTWHHKVYSFQTLIISLHWFETKATTIYHNRIKMASLCHKMSTKCPLTSRQLECRHGPSACQDQQLPSPHPPGHGVWFHGVQVCFSPSVGAEFPHLPASFAAWTDAAGESLASSENLRQRNDSH